MDATVATSTTDKFLGSRSLSVTMGKVVQNEQEYSPATIVYVASPAIQTTRRMQLTCGLSAFCVVEGRTSGFRRE
jgi:hypothetical protein